MLSPRLTDVPVTLHLSSEKRRYWSIDQSNVLLFAHPTLRSLKMSCAKIGDDIVSSLADRPRSPLKHLAFIECKITHSALKAVLSVPTALERLSLRENCDHIHSHKLTPNDVARYGRLFTSDPMAFMESLQQQKDSLKQLAYASVQNMAPKRLAFRLPAFEPRDCTGLAGFNQLRDLSVENCVLEFTKLLEMPSLAPPGLERLSLTEFQLPRLLRAGTTSAGDQGSQLASFVPVCHTIPSVQYVELVLGSVTRDEAQDLLAASRDRLKGRDMMVRMFQRGSAGAIPPFLYGEKAYIDEHVATWEGDEVLVERNGVARPRALCVECS